MTTDPFNLDRFIAAQAPVFEDVVAELKSARKRSHWMWFIFPQMRGLGQSAMARIYGIVSLEEARAFLQHESLGPRLTFCTRTFIESQPRSLREMFGSPDDVKFRSSMTLFERAALSGDVFCQALDHLCAGKRDEQTLRLIA